MFYRFTLIAVMSFTMLAACQPATNTPNTITVQAEAETFREPDQAQLTLNVSQSGDDLVALKARVDQQTSEVIMFLRKQDIPEQAITSYRLSAAPVYDYQEGQRIQRGFNVSRAIQIQLTDLAIYDIILDHALASGVTEISQAQFLVSEPDLLYNDVLQQAVKNARAKAELLAAAAGVKIVAVSQVQEMSQAPKALAFESARFRQADQVSLPGTQAIRAQVSLTYTIAPQ